MDAAQRDGSTDSDQPHEVQVPEFASLGASNTDGNGSRSIIIGVAAVVIVGVIVAGVVSTGHPGNKLSSVASVLSSTGSSSTAPPSKILTKDPEFTRLLHPPQGDALLEQSTEYTRTKQEIESKLAAIQDLELRKRVSGEEWAKVDKSAYVKKEAENLRSSFPSAMRSVLQRHRADWFEIGHVDYPGTNVLQISSVAASPIELSGDATIAMDTAQMDGVYSKFREAAKQQIQQNVEAWIHGQSCTSQLRNVCINLGGTPSQCSDPSALSDIQNRLGGGLSLDCNDNPSFEVGRNKVEKEMRQSRLVLVGQGDLLAHRIDKVLLVDYDTETALLEISPRALNAKLDWKFPPENQPDMYSSAQYAVIPETDSFKDFGAVAIHGEGDMRQNFTFNNTSPSSVTIDISVQGNDGGDFELQNDCSSGTVYTGDSCKVVVQFVPKTMGVHSATMVVGGEGWGQKTVTFKGFGTWPWNIYGQTYNSRRESSQPQGDTSRQQPNSERGSTSNPSTSESDGAGTTVRRDSKAARKLNTEGLRALAGTHPNLVEAKRLFEKAVQLDPDNVELLNNLGDVVGRLEDFKAAEAIFARVLTMAPKRRVANGNMGYVEAKLGKIDRAEVHFCEYVRAFDSFDKGEARLKASFGDPDPQVQNAVSRTIANCRP